MFFWLTTLSWLLQIPVTGFPILGWIALSAFLAMYPATWLWLLAGQLKHDDWWQRCRGSLLGAAAWVAIEMIRSRFLTGFPWDTIGSSQWQLTPLIQIASVTGVYGVSFLVVWTSLSLFSAVRCIIRHPTKRYSWMGELILPFAVVTGLFVNGMTQLRQNPATDNVLRVTSIQPAVPQTMIWDSSASSNRFTQLMTLTEQALTNKTDLLLWPEAALPELTDEMFETITNLVRRHSLWMIFNTDDVVERSNPTKEKRYDVFNSAVLLTPSGRFAASYHKRQLVIFGEYIPLVDSLPFIKWFTPITGSYKSGERITPFLLDRVTVAPLICFEDTFPHHVRDQVNDMTDLLVNLTNDGWFGEKASQWQHLSSAAFRAVENDIPLIRSCNTGVTCWVDSHGRLRDVLRDRAGSEYTAGFATWEIPTSRNDSRTQTFYNKHGDRFGWGCVGITLILLFKRLWKARAKNSTPVAASGGVAT